MLTASEGERAVIVAVDFGGDIKVPPKERLVRALSQSWCVWVLLILVDQ